MTVKAFDQSKRTFCIALFNRQLHAGNICPGNHDVDYHRGWFYLDNVPQQRPELTAEADQIMKARSHTVYYQEVWNTYVLLPNEEYP